MLIETPLQRKDEEQVPVQVRIRYAKGEKPPVYVGVLNQIAPLDGES